MPGIGFTFQDTDMNGSNGSRTWIVIAAIVTLATVGVILLVRAFGGEAEEKPAAAASTQADAASKTPEAAATKRDDPDRSQERKTGSLFSRPTAKPSNPQTTEPVLGDASETALAFMRAGEAAEKADDLYAARTNYLAALADPGCGKARPVAEARLGAVDVELVFSPREMEGKIDYMEMH